MNAANVIQNSKVPARMQLVEDQTQPERFGRLKRAANKVRALLSPRVGRDLNIETWRDLEFRNERLPERNTLMHLNRWP